MVAGRRDDRQAGLASVFWWTPYPVFDLIPAYFRRTAAEEQWDRKQSS